VNYQKKSLENDTNSVFNKIGTVDAASFMGRLVNGAMGVLGSVTLVMFVYGGILWMTAAGDSARTEKARSILVWSSLGLAVIFASYAIVKFVFEAFG
jgi:hypothetical protein